jgi:hypothetical protein
MMMKRTVTAGERLAVAAVIAAPAWLSGDEELSLAAVGTGTGRW